MKAIVFGAGKIARGFIGHLLHMDRIPFTFVDVNPSLVALLNEKRSYRVHVMGNPGGGMVQGFEAVALADAAAVARAWAEADVGFVSVGGKNLPALAEALAEAFAIRAAGTPIGKPVHLIVCENWKEPAQLLRRDMRGRLSGEALAAFDRWVGIAEAVVMRSGVEPTEAMLAEDPLCVRVSDYWELPVDGEALAGDPPAIQGVRYVQGFAGFLERKFYTYNAANGTVSYLGYLRGHDKLFDAATDPEIAGVLEGVYAETSEALARKHGVSPEEQRAFVASSRRKLQDPNIDDDVERNARDPIRKLGPDDRLIGPARLVQAYGGTPKHLAVSIAAAICYDHPADPIAQQLKRLRLERGVDYILAAICRLQPDDPLNGLVKEQISELRRRGWIS